MWYSGTNSTWWDDVMEIRNWQTICKLAGIPNSLGTLPQDRRARQQYTKKKSLEIHILYLMITHLKIVSRDTYTVFDDTMACFIKNLEIVLALKILLKLIPHDTM